MTATKAELHKSNRMTAIIGLAAVIILTSFNIWYTAYSQDKADRRWCEMMVSMDERFAQQSNLDQAQVRFAAQVHAIRESLPCKGVVIPNPSVPPTTPPATETTDPPNR